MCRYCHSFKALTADHIIPKSRGGTNERHNLQILCKYCNQNKSNLTETEVAEIFRSIKKHGVMYAWEEKYKKWLDYIEFCRTEPLNW